jgi:superfamily II DNA/RNA helicase
LSELKCIVIDEADYFFRGKDEINSIRDLDSKYIQKIPHKVQYVLFSATYPEEVKEAIGTICKEAQQISMKREMLQLDHIQQFFYQC